MKKTLLALLLICILGMLSGCQPANTENSEKSSETEQSEIENSTETENSSETEISSETEVENTEHHETETENSETESTEIPAPTRYEFTDYESANKIGRTLDLVVFDTKVYAILYKSGGSDAIESDTNPYYLVSFDHDGNNFTQVNLETPAIENEFIILKQFAIGQDQRIYALKVDYIGDSGSYDTPLLKHGLRLVCWNPDGTLHSDIPLGVSDIGRDIPNTNVTNISVSANGSILLCCTTYSKPSFIICLRPDGSIRKVVMGESQHENASFTKNNDGSLFALRLEYTNGTVTHSYYLGFDVNTQEFLPEIDLKDLLIWRRTTGENSSSLYFTQDDRLYKYYFETQEKQMLIDLTYNNLPGFSTILPTAEDNYIGIYSKDSSHYIGFLKQVP